MTDEAKLEKAELERARALYSTRRWTAGISASILLAASLIFACWGQGKKIDCGGVKMYQAIVLAAWTLLPPIWFWYEYFFLFRNAFPKADPGEMDRFKHGQDLSSKIWLATVSVLLMLYFWKDLGRT